jgi:transposase-like protein
MRKRYTGEQRAELIDLVMTEGSTVAMAAKRLGVTASTAYHWVKQAGAGPPARRFAERHGLSRRTRPPTLPAFARLVSTDDLAATIAVGIGGAEIQVRRGFDAELLRAVVVALGGDAA